ncbi:hypothetical protein E4U52_008200 [Claviceps spartinae]|nr:hypothetical protein E4U52_008200 [Claviceps spartinae]
MSSTTYPVEAEPPRSGFESLPSSRLASTTAGGLLEEFQNPSCTPQCGNRVCDSFAHNIYHRVLEAFPSYVHTLIWKSTSSTSRQASRRLNRQAALLPDDRVEVVRNDCDGVLIEAVSSPSNAFRGYSSPIVALRKHLDLYANVRPFKTIMNVSRFESYRQVIVRENTADLYVKEERTIESSDAKVSEAIKRISERASFCIAAMAGEIANRRHQ